MTEFRLTQISDTHLARRLKLLTDNFHCVSEHIAANRPDLVINSGDIGWDGPTSRADLEFAKELHAALPVTCRYLPGNHDIGDNPTAVGKPPSCPTTEKARDAFVAVFDAKYAYEFWRPVTAIRNGGADGTWLPLLDTPMHPEYPCAHCISAGAVGEVLEAHFGKGEIPAVSMVSPTAPGVTRRWTRIADYVQEVNDARVWGGIHYRNSTRVGEDMGRQIGALAVNGHLTPERGKQ